MISFIKQILDAKSALNAVSDELGPAELMNISELTYYIVFSNGVDAGAVQPETAHVVGYAGTWAAEGSPVSFASNACKVVMISGVSFARRLRISTAITNGTVSAWAVGRGY